MHFGTVEMSVKLDEGDRLDERGASQQNSGLRICGPPEADGVGEGYASARGAMAGRDF